MALIDTLKSLLGLDRSDRGPNRGTTGHGRSSSPDSPAQGAPDPSTERSIKTGPASEAGATEATQRAPERDSDDRQETRSATQSRDSDAASGDGAGSEPVTEIKGIGSAYGERLAAAGVTTIAELAEAEADALAAETGISRTRIEDWIDQASARSS